MKELDKKIRTERIILEDINKQITKLQSMKSYRKRKLQRLLEISPNQLCLEI